MYMKIYSRNHINRLYSFKYLCIYILLLVIKENVHADDNMLGPGHFIVEKIYSCDNDDKYPMKISIYKHKINRTHDVYDASIDMDRVIDDNISIFVEISKYVDGGYKPYYTLHDKCACCFIKKYAQDNFERLLTMIDIDPPDCPMPKGYHNVTDFVFDNNELPEEGVYGEYKVKCTFKSLLAEELACLMMSVNFLEDD